MKLSLRIITFLIIIIALLGIVKTSQVDAVAAYADVYNGLTLTIQKNGDVIDFVNVTGYEGTAKDIIIPAEIYGAPVTNILINWESTGKDNIESITIQGNPTAISLASLPQLKKVKIASGEDINITACKQVESVQIENVKDLSISQATLLENINLPHNIEKISIIYSGIKEITIPANATEVSFFNCKSLVKATVEEGMTKLPFDSFSSCTSLTTVILPETLSEIGNNAFSSCTSLQELAIPNSVQKIGRNAFNECKALNKINIPEGLSTIEEWTFANCSSLTQLEIPGTVTTIGDYAFKGCSNLADFTIPNSVNKIGTGAFSECTSLKKLVIPLEVTNIAGGTFEKCTSLEDIELSPRITSIGTGAFSRCSSLRTVELPQDITSIEASVFNDCISLNNITIPEKVKSIGYRAFYNCQSLQNINIPSTVETLGGQAFSECNKLEKISIPEGVKIIEEETFYNCSALKEAKLPISLENIGNDAFAGCPLLKDVTIYGNVKEIGYRAFDSSTSKVEIIRGYADTCAEEYAKEHNIQFIQLKGIWNPIIIPENYYVLTFTNQNEELLPSGLQILIDDIEYICNKGIVAFNKEEHKDTVHIKLTYNGNEYEFDHKLNENKKGYIKIPKSVYDLVVAEVNGYDVLTSSKILNLGGTSVMFLELGITNFENEVKFSLYQGDKLLTATTGIGSVMMDVPTAGLEKGKDLNVVVSDMGGNVLSSKYLHLQLINIDLAKLGGSVELGEKIKIKLPENLGILAGAEFEIPFLGENCPIKFECTDETIKMGITTSKDELELEDYEKEVKKLLKEKRNVVREDSFEIEMTVYNEMTFDNGIFKENKSFGAFVLKLKQSFSQDAVVWVIPVTAKITFSLDGTMEFGIIYDVNTNEYTPLTDITITGAIQANVGVGVSAIGSVGIYGRIETEYKFGILPDLKFESISLYGDVGIYAEVFGYEQIIPILKPKDKLVMNDKLEWEVTENKVPGIKPASLYNVNMYNVSSRNATATEKTWNSKLLNEADTSTLLTENVYTYTNQELVSSNTDTLMVFLDNDVSRNEYNFKTLKYSIYDSNEKKWSTPTKLDDNETQDNSFMTYTDGTDIYVIYAEEKILLDNKDLTNYAKNQEITVAKWNSTTKKFETIQSLTDNDTYDTMPAITVVNNTPIAVWVNNASNSSFGTTKDNLICYSKYENGVWTSTQTLTTGYNSITDITAGKIGNETYIVVIVDEDNNLETSNDRNLKVIDLNGTEKSISTGTNGNLNILDNKLLWYSDGNISAVADINNLASTLLNESVNNLSSNYVIITKDDKLVVIYVAETNNGYGIYEILQDENKNFTNPILIKELTNNANCYGATYTNNELLVAYTETEAKTNGTEIQKTSNLYSFIEQDKFDIALVDIEYDESTFSPNQPSNISLYIKNNREIEANSINIKIVDADDETIEIYNQTISKKILSGNTEKIDINNLVINNARAYKVIITETNNTDINSSNNEKTFDVTYSDLKISAEQIITASGNRALVTIENNGKFDAQNVKLNVMQGENIVDNAVVGEVLSSNVAIVWVDLKDEYFEEGRKDGIVTFAVETSTKELYEENNEYALSVVNYEESYTLGDVNADGTIDSKDATMVLKYATDKIELTETQKLAANVNRDGAIDSKDATLILKYATDKITEF